jgi:zinc and cadmium transporter
MIYAVLILSVLAGALAVLKFKLGEPRRVKLITAFTGAYLMALTCLHLLPEVFHGADKSALSLGAFILLGFFLQVVLDNFSGGVEHGHAHHTHGSAPIAVMVGLCLHAFLEAMPLGHAKDSQLLVAIGVHKFPVAIVLLSMLLHNGNSKTRAYVCLAIFCIMAPAGAAIGALPALEQYAPQLLAVVIGIFMHVSTTILFESGEEHHYNLQKGAAIALGAGIAALGVLLPLHSHAH